MSLAKSLADMRAVLAMRAPPFPARGAPRAELAPDGWPLVCHGQAASPEHDCARGGGCVLLPLPESPDGSPALESLAPAELAAVRALLDQELHP